MTAVDPAFALRQRLTYAEARVLLCGAKCRAHLVANGDGTISVAAHPRSFRCGYCRAEARGATLHADWRPLREGRWPV